MKMFVRRSPLLVKRFLKTAVPARAVVGYLLPTKAEVNSRPNWGELNSELRITAAGGRESYSLTGIFNGDEKLAPFAAPGTDLPVRVDPEKPNKVAIDWKQWKEEGGGGGDRDAAAQANQEAFRDSNVDEASADAAADDASSSAQSSSQTAFLAAWEGQVLAGLDEARRVGKLSDEEYQQARRDAGL